MPDIKLPATILGTIENTILLSPSFRPLDIQTDALCLEMREEIPQACCCIAVAGTKAR